MLKTMIASTLLLVSAAAAADEGADEILVVGIGNTPISFGVADLMLSDLPQSVSVISREQIDLSGAGTLDDVLRQTPGITLFGANEASYYARGFQIDTLQFDGVALDTYAQAMTAPDTALYDRVEVLRGAAGLWQGAGSFGGAINMVRKRAGADGGRARATLDTEGAYRLEADVSHALDSEGRFRVRAVGVYEHSNSFIDYVDGNKGLIYGAFDAELTPTTTLSAAVSYQKRKDRPFPDYLPRYANGDPLSVDRETFLGAAWNRRTVETTQLFGEITQKLGADWTLKLGLNHLDSSRDSKTLQASGAVNPALGRTNALASANALSTKQTSLDVNVEGRFELLGRPQDVQLGGNWRKLANDLLNGSRSTPGGIDVQNFDPSAFPEPDIRPDQGSETTDTTQYGLYAAVRLSPVERLHLILGGRLSWYETIYDFKFLPFPGLIDDHQDYRRNGVFTPYAGATFELSEAVTAYASYAETFRPQSARQRDGAFIAPLTGKTYELGVKGNVLNGALLASAALYRVEQVNRAQEDPEFSCAEADAQVPPMTGRCFIAAGKVRTQGVELELTGRPTPNWLIAGGYTYATNKVLRDRDSAGAPTSAQGRPFASFTPEHMLRLWSNYRFDGALEGLSLGGSFSYQSRWRQVSTATYSQAPYALVGLYAGYDVTRDLTLAVNLDNLFDETYFESISSTSFGNRYGAPRRAMFTLRGRF